MNWLGATELFLLVALVLVLLWLVWVFGRRRWLGRQGGTFDCSARLETAVPNRGWVLGVARYSGDLLEWHRVFGFSLAPRLRFNRTGTTIADQRPPSAKEILSLYEGQWVVSPSTRAEMLSRSRSRSAARVTGLLVRLEVRLGAVATTCAPA